MSVTKKRIIAHFHWSLQCVIRPWKPDFLNKHSFIPSSYSTGTSQSVCPFASLAHQVAELAFCNLGSSSSISPSSIFLIWFWQLCKYPGLLSNARSFVMQGLNTSLFTDTISVCGLCFWKRRGMRIILTFQTSLVLQWRTYLRSPKGRALVWETPLTSFYQCSCQRASFFW